MGRRPAPRGTDSGLPQGVRRAGIRSGADPAARLVPDKPRTPRARGARKITDRLSRRDAALRATGTRPAELPPGEPPTEDRRGGEPRPDRRVDQPRAGPHARRHGRHREYGRAGFESRIPVRAPRLPDRPRGGQVARGRLHRHLPRLRRGIRPAHGRGVRRHVRRAGARRGIPLPQGDASERCDEAPRQPRGPPHAAGRRTNRHRMLPLHRPRQAVRRHSADSRNPRRSPLERGNRAAEGIRRGGVPPGPPASQNRPCDRTCRRGGFRIRGALTAGPDTAG